jgi:hypothetical protein
MKTLGDLLTTGGGFPWWAPWRSGVQRTADDRADAAAQRVDHRIDQAASITRWQERTLRLLREQLDQELDVTRKAAERRR